MQMHEIRYFLAMCETLNFRRAAMRCNISQPALTKGIQKLEEKLGGQLFRRERNLTHLTDFGRLVRPYLEQIDARHTAAKTAARNFLRLEKAPLNVGMMVTIGPLRFTRFLSGFQHDHPGIELWLHEGTLQELSEKLMSGAIDLAVMGLVDELGGRFDAIPLYTERYVAVFPRGHRYEAMNHVPFSDLVGEPYIDRLSCEARDRIIGQWDAHGAEFRCAHRSHRDDWVQGLVLAGFGIAVMPEFSISAIGLKSRVTSEPEVTRQVSLVSVAGRRFSPGTAEFVKEVKSFPWLATQAA
ncbi:LysR family transcriptional regulator [Stella sp.]|uniref:LysR family transcriptional regulator n=1 Tax=Stella sp. TaxID=2912054 RepID=UPI0035AE1658